MKIHKRYLLKTVPPGWHYIRRVLKDAPSYSGLQSTVLDGNDATLIATFRGCGRKRSCQAVVTNLKTDLFFGVSGIFLWI
jgi:hypothetical protein